MTATAHATRSAAMKRIPSLDGMRALSILLVLFGHGIGAAYNSTAPHWAQLLFAILGNSHVGVVTFFVISGYLITSLMRREWERTGTVDLKDFYMRRTFRIFPAFYVYLLVIGLLTLLGFLKLSGAAFLSAGSYTWNYTARLVPPSPDLWFIGHFWTLAVEEQFYLLWPLCFLLLKPAKAWKLALALVLISPVLRVGTYYLFPALQANISNQLHTMADTLMIGCMIALLQGESRFEEWVVKLLKTPVPALLAFFYLFLFDPLLHQRYEGKYLLPVGLTLEIVCISIVLLYVTRLPQSSVGRLLNSKPLVFIGVLSYSLYLWQQMFLGWQHKPWNLPIPLNYACVFIAALLSYYLVEQPFLNLRQRLSHRPASLTPIPPVETPAAAPPERSAL